MAIHIGIRLSLRMQQDQVLDRILCSLFLKLEFLQNQISSDLVEIVRRLCHGDWFHERVDSNLPVRVI